MNNKLYIETYGCQMNFSDSEIVASIMTSQNYSIIDDPKKADIILVNTCSIRDNAEQRVFNRLNELRNIRSNNKKVRLGIIGCMAERLKEKLIHEQGVDLVIGPDAYRDLPRLINSIDESGQQAVNVILSEEETYDNIPPVRYNSNNVSAFISIMRGCENFCSYCVVPYTRGKERSRDPETIIKETEQLVKDGYKEVTLLGQNVNSYNWDKNWNFPKLIKKIAQINPNLRVRFATSHPKDISDELIETIAQTKNICNAIHLPVQSGSNNTLKKMNRKYTREWYMNRIKKIKELIPDVGLSTDIIAGYCGENEIDHQDTLKIMKEVEYDFAFMFKYSERPGTAAAKKFADDVDEKTKTRRLTEIINLQQQLSLESNKKDIGKEFEVLVEGYSKRSKDRMFGRNQQNKVIVFPKENFKPGNYVNVKVTECTAATLIGEPV